MIEEAKEVEEAFRQSLVLTAGRTRNGEAADFFYKLKGMHPGLFACKRFEKGVAGFLKEEKDGKKIYILNINGDVYMAAAPEPLVYAALQRGVFRRSKNKWQLDTEYTTMGSMRLIGEMVEEFVQEWKEFREKEE